MHKVYTVVLRLFVDSDAPENIKGSLQLSSKNLALSFSDGQTLLHLLSQVGEDEAARARAECRHAAAPPGSQVDK